MERFAREDVREVLASFGVKSARRATSTDSSEEVILLTKSDFTTVNVEALTLALMDTIPHTKVWVAEEHALWTSEPI